MAMQAEQHAAQAQLFADEGFPATWTSLRAPCDAVGWFRPHELRDQPQLFVDGSSRFDVSVGSPDFTWLVAACASIAEHPELLKQVIPEGQVLFGPGYDGSVKFRLWSVGEWEEVRIDDRLPVDAAGRPAYARCAHSDEFWLPLLEKALARSLGGYDGLTDERCANALLKLTGFVVETVGIDNWNVKKDFDVIRNALDNEGIIVCRSKTILGYGVHEYCYTLSKAVHLKDGSNRSELRLVRVRNPLGNNIEWAGAWKDGDLRWDTLSKDVRKLLEYKPGKDGEFWMEMKDFSKHFYSAVIARKKPKDYKKMNLVEEKKCFWKREEGDHEFYGPIHPESFAKRPQFLLEVLGGKGKTGIENVQIYAELVRDETAGIGIYIFEAPVEAKKLCAEELLAADVVAGKNTNSSAVFCKASLRSGRQYVLAASPGSEGVYLLRLYSPYPHLRLAELTA